MCTVSVKVDEAIDLETFRADLHKMIEDNF